MQLISSVLRASAPICAYSTRHSSTHHRLFQASFFLWGDYPTARRPQLFDICCRRRHSAANPPAAVAAVDRRDRRAEGRSTVARTRRRIHPIPRQKNLQFRPPPNACQIVYSESFFGRDNELHIFHGNYLLMDNKHRKLFVITQSEGRKFMPKMHQNTLGGRAPPRPAGGIAACAVLQGNSPPKNLCAPPGTLPAMASTSFGWGKGGNVTSAGWQVTLCDPMLHVSSRSSVATLRTAIRSLLTYLLLRGTEGMEGRREGTEREGEFSPHSM